MNDEIIIYKAGSKINTTFFQLTNLCSDRDSIESDNSFTCLDDFFDDVLSTAESDKMTPEEAIECFSRRELYDNQLLADEYRYHLQILTIDSSKIPEVAQSLSKVHNQLGDKSFKNILKHLPYIVHAKTKTEIKRMVKTIFDSNGKCRRISNDTFYDAFDKKLEESESI